MKEIREKFGTLEVYEERCVSDDYDEFVIYNKDLDEWNKIFVGYFGEPTKPAGKRPSSNDLELTREHGGIFLNQTLFKRELDDAFIIAMMWPWQDSVHTTLKIVRIKK